MALIDKTEIIAEEIAKEGLDALDSKYQKTVGFFAWDYFVAIGQILSTLWKRITYVANCLVDLKNMEYDDLVNFVFQTSGIVAKSETSASGSLTLTNGNGTVSFGDIFETADGLQFRAIETKTLENGAKFEVECLTAGIIGNVPQNAITVIPTTIQGLVSVTNEKAFTNGYERETKEDLLERYYERLRNPVTSGNVYHYVQWAKEVTGVGKALCKPLWDGDNTVKVVILDANRNIPSNDLINAVQNYIDPGAKGLGLGEAPIGAYCTVTGATPKNLNISARIKLKSGIGLDDVLENIRRAIEDYFKSIAFDKNVTYISYAKIGSLIMSADGVYDYESDSLLLNGDTDNIVLMDNNDVTEIAVLNDLDIEVVE